MFARLGFCLSAAVAAVALSTAAIPARTSAQSSSDLEALLASERGDWAQARHLAALSDDPMVGKLVLWIDATSARPSASFTDIAGFVIDNPDWPQQKTLRLKAEQALDPSTSDLAVLSWFQRNEPQTLSGAKRFANALIANGEIALAQQVARTAWRNADSQTVDDEDDFWVTFGDLLTFEDHARRMDRLLWAGRVPPTQRVLARTDAGHRALGEARIALRQSREDAPGKVAAVPAELQGDAGLIYDQVRWYRRKDYESAARQLLTQYRVDAAQPDLFWQERGQLARAALSVGDPNGAYRTAGEHGFARGSEFADSEWLAGWIALRFLAQPDLATPHFVAMYDAVTHPVSRARGAYWLGRTAAAMGDGETANLWYRTAAQHAMAFYGQLSNAEVSPKQPLLLPADPTVGTAEIQQFEHHELVRAIRLLSLAGEREDERAFVLRLAELSESGAWKDLAASLAHEINRPDLAVAVARQAIRSGTPLIRNGYPVLSIADSGLEPYAVEMPLVHAIVRQESAFDVRAVSPAGAQGLMQVMPGTARSIANTLAMAYAPAELTGNPEYNIRLGRAYLGSLLNRFDGSYILALAAYNAGPSRVSQWLNSNGDPRTGADVAIDWIELIPFAETRNYVQRCLENLQVYRARLGGNVQLAQTLDGDLLMSRRPIRDISGP